MMSFCLHRPTRDSEDDEDDEKKGKGCTLQVLMISSYVCDPERSGFVRGCSTILSEQKCLH